MHRFILRFVCLGILVVTGNTGSARSLDANKCVQNQLNAAGFDVGVVDGALGRKSKSVMAAFEKQHGSVSKRPLNDDYALIYCRQAGLKDPTLQRFWPSRVAPLVIKFGDSILGSPTDNKMFMDKAKREVETAHRTLKSVLRTSLAGTQLVLVAGSEREAVAMAKAHSKVKLVGLKKAAKDICKSRRNFSGTVYPNMVLMCRTGAAEIGAEIDTGWLKFLLARSLFYGVQYQLVGTTRSTSDKTVVNHDGPLWLTHGAAQAVANHITTGLPLTEYKSRKLAQIDKMPSLAKITNPSDLRDRQGLIYRAGIVAVADLLPNEDYSKIAKFYESLGVEADWETAFERSFGQDIEAFSKAFGQAY